VSHDAETFAIHETHDSDYDVQLRNEFFKISPDQEDWVTTASNINSMNGDHAQLSVVYSFSLEKLNTAKADLRKIMIAEDGASLRI
jgi:hypothetical protein